MRTQVVRVERAFYLDGKLAKVGEQIEVPVSLAVELRTVNKVSFVTPKAEPAQPAAPAAEPAKPAAKTTESKAAEPQKGAKS